MMNPVLLLRVASVISLFFAVDVRARHDANPLFAGGRPLQEDGAYPAPSAVADIWREAGVHVDEAMKTASVNDLGRPSPEGVPSFNGGSAALLRRRSSTRPIMSASWDI